MRARPTLVDDHTLPADSDPIWRLGHEIVAEMMEYLNA